MCVCVCVFSTVAGTSVSEPGLPPTRHTLRTALRSDFSAWTPCWTIQRTNRRMSWDQHQISIRSAPMDTGLVVNMPCLSTFRIFFYFSRNNDKRFTFISRDAEQTEDSSYKALWNLSTIEAILFIWLHNLSYYSIFKQQGHVMILSREK